MTQVATGSRFVRQLLHTGHYAAAQKKVTYWNIGVTVLVSFFGCISPAWNGLLKPPAIPEVLEEDIALFCNKTYEQRPKYLCYIVMITE